MVEVKSKTKKILILLAVLFLVVIILFAIFYLNKTKCPGGYELMDDKCIKIETVNPKVDKYCDEGYQLENDTCFKTEVTAPAVKYYCDDTYKSGDNMVRSKSTLSGTTCSYTISHKPVEKKSCLPSAIPYSDTQCRSTITLSAATRTDLSTGNIIYYCVGDAVLSGTNCLLYSYSDYVYEYICADGYVLNNGNCVKYFTYDARWEANCPNDYTFVDKNTCTRKIVTKVKHHYDCPSDYDLVNKTCQKKIYYNKK